MAEAARKLTPAPSKLPGRGRVYESITDTVGGPAVKWGTLAKDMPDVGGAVRPLADDAADFGRTYFGLAGGGTNWDPRGIAGIGERIGAGRRARR